MPNGAARNMAVQTREGNRNEVRRFIRNEVRQWLASEAKWSRSQRTGIDRARLRLLLARRFRDAHSDEYNCRGTAGFRRRLFVREHRRAAQSQREWIRAARPLCQT